MLWFNGATNAEDGQPPATPSDIATIAPGLQAGPNGYVIWEGNQINGLFPGDRGFHTQIRGTGASQPVSSKFPPTSPPLCLQAHTRLDISCLEKSTIEQLTCSWHS
jgi:hypothetical protein